MSCKIFTSLPSSLCVRLQSIVLIARPLIVQATSRETYTFYLASRRGVYFRERNTQSAYPVALRRIGTKDNRRMSCNVRNTALRNHAPRYFFHANLTPSTRLCYVKSACDRFAEYRVKYEIVRPRKMRHGRTEIFIFQEDNKRILQFSSLSCEIIS